MVHLIRLIVSVWALADIVSIVSSYRMRNTPKSPQGNPFDDRDYICCVSKRPHFCNKTLVRPCPITEAETKVHLLGSWVAWLFLRLVSLLLCLYDKVFWTYRMGAQHEYNSWCIQLALVLSFLTFYLRPVPVLE